MNAHSRYSSPLSERYASKAMLELWSPQTRHGLWRRLWLALAESERALGIDISEAAVNEMRAHLDDIDFPKVAEYEKRFRHDVMAHVHAFGEAAPLARGVIHLGATSAFVTDNGDLIQMRRGLELLRARVIAVIGTMSTFARQWRAEPTLGYTHLQPAQLTTVGKRATLWLQDLVLDLSRTSTTALPICRCVESRERPERRRASSNCSTGITTKCATSIVAYARRWAFPHRSPCRGRPTRVSWTRS